MRRLLTVLLVVTLCLMAAPPGEAGGLTRLSYNTAKKTALKKARKVTHRDGGKVTTMLNTGRNRWYAQVTMDAYCWTGMNVFLRRGQAATRVTDLMCEDDPTSSDGGSTGGTIEQFPDVHCPECFYSRGQP